MTVIPNPTPFDTCTLFTQASFAINAVHIAAPLHQSISYVPKRSIFTHTISNKAPKPELAAANRNVILLFKNPTTNAINVKQDPTYSKLVQPRRVCAVEETYEDHKTRCA